MYAVFVQSRSGEWSFQEISSDLDSILVARAQYEAEYGLGTIRVFLLT